MLIILSVLLSLVWLLVGLAVIGACQMAARGDTTPSDSRVAPEGAPPQARLDVSRRPAGSRGTLVDDQQGAAAR